MGLNGVASSSSPLIRHCRIDTNPGSKLRQIAVRVFDADHFGRLVCLIFPCPQGGPAESHECPLWVNNGLSRPTAATSAFGGKADEIGTITDIGI